MKRATRPRGERGTALVELTWLGILLLVPMIWIVLSVFEVQRGAFGVSAAARSAGRAYALAPDDDHRMAPGTRGRGRSHWPTRASPIRVAAGDHLRRPRRLSHGWGAW